MSASASAIPSIDAGVAADVLDDPVIFLLRARGAHVCHQGVTVAMALPPTRARGTRTPLGVLISTRPSSYARVGHTPFSPRHGFLYIYAE
jgi:hypothetical protein